MRASVKLLRRTAAILAASVVALAMPSAAVANGIVGVGPVKIVAMSPAAFGFVWVELNTTVSCASVGGPSGVTAVMLSPDSNFAPYEGGMTSRGFEIIYSALLTAMTTGSDVNLHIGPAAETGSVCFIERVKMYAPA